MSIRLPFVVGALSSFALCVPAGAKSFDDDPRLGRQVLRDFAKCAVRSEHDLAKKLVLSTAALPLLVEDLQKVLDPRCFGFWNVNFRANDLAVRGAFAEELVRRDLKQWPTLDPSDQGPLDWSVSPVIRSGPGLARLDPAFVQKAHDSLVADARVGRLGECVVRSSPAGAEEVLNQKAESGAEVTALKALTPQIARCIGAGLTSAFSRVSLRYAIALSYYRLANAAAPSRHQETAQ